MGRLNKKLKEWKKLYEEDYLARSFPIEELDDRCKVAYNKMSQEEFDIKWGYKKPKQLKCMELYKQMLNL